MAQRLTSLASGAATVSADHAWLPAGFDNCNESELHDSPSLLDADRRNALRDWWLPVQRGQQKLPNWDVASTCLVHGKPGLLLIEAKAHDEELRKEEMGKLLADGCSDGSFANHKNVGRVIADAAAELQKATGRPFAISRDVCYQMSNRFAVACKLTELGIPVVLIYLGFLQAQEMVDRGRPLESSADWEHLVHEHSRRLFPPDIWGKRLNVHGQVLCPMIQSITVPIEIEPEAA